MRGSSSSLGHYSGLCEPENKTTTVIDFDGEEISFGYAVFKKKRDGIRGPQLSRDSGVDVT